MKDANILRDEFMQAFRDSLLRHGLAYDTLSANGRIMTVVAEGIAHVVAPLLHKIEAYDDKRLEKVFDMLDLLAKQVNEHNRVLKAAPEPQEMHGVVQCYCGTRHLAGVCPTCNKGAKPEATKATFKNEWKATHVSHEPPGGYTLGGVIAK